MAEKRTMATEKKTTTRKSKTTKISESDNVNDIIENESTIEAKEVKGKITPLTTEDATEGQETANAGKIETKSEALNFEELRKQLNLPVLPCPEKDALVKLAVVTGSEKQEKSDIQTLLMFAEWRKNSLTNDKKYYAVMNGPNAPYVKEYAKNKGKDFQPVNVYWQHGLRAMQMAYEHLVGQLDKNSVLIILYGRPNAQLRYLKGIAERKGIPTIYVSAKELNNEV